VFGIIYTEQNKAQTPAILNVIYGGICFKWNLDIKTPVFSGKLPRICSLVDLHFKHLY
jgi:hypothetical protein